jgi:TonB family protein
MTDATTHFPALEPASPAGPDRREGWTFARWLTAITLVFATQVGLIFLLGEKNAPLPRAVHNVPLLKLANNADEQFALNDPTLFAMPNPKDFAFAAWNKMTEPEQPSFRWTEPPRWLPFSMNGLGATFGRFMQTNFPASQPFNFRPVPELDTPTMPAEPVVAENSTMRIEGKLALRQLPAQISLTNWPYADVLAPCVVQVLVDPAGNVISAVLLKSCDYPDADSKALEVVRTLRFMPATSPALGRVLFHWQTVPPSASP